MKTRLFNILASVLAFYIPLQIALLTNSQNVVQAVAIAFLIQWICFIPAFIFQTEKFYDLTGSITYISVVLFTLFKSNSFNLTTIIISACVIIWAIRLGSFLFLRIKKDGEDKRFRSIKPSFTQFFMTWTLQGTWVSMCLLCVLTAISSNSGIVFNYFFFTGLFLFFIGFILEIISDIQKTNFRKIENNRDKFITTGLWAYSRHPNYLGELILWIGISVMSYSSLSGLGYLTLISPLFIYVLLVYISGVRMLEQSGQKKWGHLPEYKSYIEKTPKFFFKFK